MAIAKLDSSKDRYSYIVALLAVILSLTAFEDRLSRIVLSFGFFNASILLLGIVFVGLGILSAYFFALHYMSVGGRFENSWPFRGVKILADCLYVVGMMLPVVLSLIWVANNLVIQQVVDVLEHIYPATLDMNKVQEVLASIASLVLGLATGTAAYLYTRQISWYRSRMLQNEIEEKRDRLLKRAEMLYKQQYYSSSIVEAYKMVELAIAAALSAKGQPITARGSLELTATAQQLGILSEKDVLALRSVRRLRNQASQMDITLKRSQADEAISKMKAILKKLIK